MSIRKTSGDVVREGIAAEINATLVGTGISVTGGGSKGPYSVTVNRLSRKDLDKVIGAIQFVTARKPSEAP